MIKSDKGKKVLGVIVFFVVMVIVSLFIGVISAEEAEAIIVDTEKGVPGFWTEPARDHPGNWWYVHDHPDTTADGWFDTNAYPPGQGNGSFWYTISFPDMGECKGIWETSLPYTGKYGVFAWIPSPDHFDPYLDESTPPSDYLPTKRAQYKIFHDNGVATVAIDQNEGGFTHLGVFDFDTTARVELSSNGVEFWRSVAFDAVKFVPVVNDMAVTDVFIMPPTTSVGQSTAICVTVTNDGTQQEDNVPVKAFVDGAQVGLTRYVSLDPGASDTMTFLWIPHATKNYSVEAEVGVVDGETDTGDNTATDYWLITYITSDNSKAVFAPRGMEPDGVGIAFFNKTSNIAPVADFTYSPDDPIVNETITFNASSSYDPDGTITNYERDFGDGTTGTGIITIHSYSSAGNYTVTLTVTDDGGLTNSTSTTVTVNPAYGWFTTGQDADILLSGIDFNNAGYLNTPGDGLLFNHPMNIAIDGTRLLLADTRNNRVLVWSSIPDGNVPPDIALGQDNLTTNNPGTGLNQMNWPVGVSTANDKVVIADTNNNRLLIWNTFPTTNGQPADLYIDFKNYSSIKERIEWPWAVWTNGTKLIATSTVNVPSSVLIWNTFPTTNNQIPDLYLRGKNPDDGTERFGTPRSIGTDGESYLVIGDHNPVGSSYSGSFFWNHFPTTDNEPYDFFMTNPVDPGQRMMGSVKSADGKFITVASPGIAIWNSVPTEVVEPDLFVGKCDENGYFFDDGDGSDLAITPSGKLFISLYNGNKIVVFNSLPTFKEQCPDYAIGAPDINTNTLETNYIITNPIPATNGKSLFVSSDFDWKLYAWKSIPTESGIHPDTVYYLNFPPEDNALYNNTLALAGWKTVQIWTSLPTNGNPPDITFDGQIGPVTFQYIKGIALDDRYLYIADRDAGKLYVWSALPNADSSPLFSLDIGVGGEATGRLSSDGTYLAFANTGNGKVSIYSVDGLSGSSTPLVEISEENFLRISYPTACVADNHLFISDNNWNRILCWESIQDAIDGNAPDAVLGQAEHRPAIGVNTLFRPQGLAFHRNRLWVAEFKFSGRLLGFKFQVEGPFIEVTPTFHDFGDKYEGETDNTTFELWNSGTGTLTYSLSETCGWVDVNPTSGSSTGEHDTITVDIDTTGLSEGTHTCDITISSNGGSGTFTVTVNVASCECEGTYGVYRNGQWILSAGYRFNYGNPTDIPVTGDWDGVDECTIGVYRNGQWILRDSNSAGSADYRFNYGNPTDIPVTGDWNGDGECTIGVYRNGQWILRNSNSAGSADYRFNFGNPTDVPVTGDWNGDGECTIGVYRNGQWILRDSNSAGAAGYRFNFGNPTDVPVTGDWNGDGESTIGVYRNGQWILRNSNSAGGADYRFNYGNPTDKPVTGDWD